MSWRWILWMFLVAAAAGKGKKNRHNKPGRALLDRLSSTTVGEVVVSREWGLVPPPLDVAPYSVVVANATCGDDGAEEYCRDTPGKRGIVCDVCEGPDGPGSRRHPASHTVDGDPTTWWQSPSQAAGDYRHVSLVATLPDKMELLHVIIKSGPSPRPLAWSLEVSLTENGEDWRMIKAFGDRDHCRKLWDLRPERRRRKARAAKRTSRADKPTCSTQFASPRPLENGEMHVGVGEVPARRVRISFMRAHPAPSTHQYYSVRTLTLAARCLCHSHAERCRVNKQGTKCECLHGTCGSHCHKCCSGAQWSPQVPCDTSPTVVPIDENLVDLDLESKIEDVFEGNSVEKECFCGERGACAYDDAGTILCVNCTGNRAGPLCDRCLLGYYSPDDGPCQPCPCHPEGSDGTCIWDKQRHSVQCSCNVDVTGALCDSCLEGGGRFPLCGGCDHRGVVGGEGCQCKSNVIGPLCDRCASGYFGLSEQLEDGCLPCYCSGLPVPCELGEATESMVTEVPLGTQWLITDSNLSRSVEPSVDDEGRPYILNFEVEGWSGFSWRWRNQPESSDPQSSGSGSTDPESSGPGLPGPGSTGSGLRGVGYGARVRAVMTCGVVRGDTGGVPTKGPDVMLVAKDGTVLYYGNNSHETPGEVVLSATLVEEGWYSEAGPVSRSQLMDVLVNLETVLFRALHHTDQDEVRLDSVQIVSSSVPWESCSCPAGYSGRHCEACAHAHTRVAGVCVPCPCHMHAECHSVDGPCGPCGDNTTGPQCERCLPGYYGNPLHGACKQCACPLLLASNNFSPNCALATQLGDEYVCTQCPDGYAGDHCELCDLGYWGSPLTPGRGCAPCACAGAACDPTTGACVVCAAHAQGARCSHCEEGYYLTTDADGNSHCAACACAFPGALSAACGAEGCACRQGWGGRRCDQCADGHAVVSLGCPPCRCGLAAVTSQCDSVTGDCQCQPGAAPPHCDTCQIGYYQLEETGCTGCNCSSIGAEGNACDIKTGQCRCKPHAAGRACDTCEEGYWGLHLGFCRPCPCGAGAAACDADTGACACNVGVGGKQCDRCLSGYYGFSPQGCLECPLCTDGKVCSEATGRCVCPAHSLGPGCRSCAPGHWGGPACRPCHCGPGAKSDTCDSRTGQCPCRAGFSGPRCDVCAPGRYGPRCRPCGCHEAGTVAGDPMTCDDDGRCRCKENVVGDKCDRCLPGTFGLSVGNPSGCTACFCFSRSAACRQAGLARGTLHHAVPRHLTVLHGTLQADQDSLLAVHSQSPEATITLPSPPVPVYMELDKSFLGDKVTSYGGLISFTVEQEGGEELGEDVMMRFPLVRLYGRSIVLDYYERIPPTNNTHYVRLHESLWRVRGLPLPPASRPALMLALQQLDAVLLRVTTRAPTRYTKVHALLLNVSMDTTIPGLSRSPPALGVELCECPNGYSAPSCHRPAPGFWMPPPTVHWSDAGGTIVINMEGDARPCECNGRSNECDAVTGDCLNCTSNTSGPRCAACAPGYHGRPPACQPCPCPHGDHNRATTCAVSAGRVTCQCLPGYSGPDCSSCAPHYYLSRGHCVPCACAGGARGGGCDARGKCHCRPYAVGHKCQSCVQRGMWLHDAVCRACDNCTQTLLDSVEKLKLQLNSEVDPTSLDRIPKPFPALRQYQQNITYLRNTIHNFKQKEINKDFQDDINNLEAHEHSVFTEANRFKTGALSREKEAQYLGIESMKDLDEVLRQKLRLGEEVGRLDEFSRGERHLNAHRALKEGKHLLLVIDDVKLGDYLAAATDVADMAKSQSISIQKYNDIIETSAKRLQELRARLLHQLQNVEELELLAEKVGGEGGDDGRRGRVAALRGRGAQCRGIMDEVIALNPSNYTIPLSNSLSHSLSLTSNFPALTAELQVLALAAEEKEGILYNLTPKYREKYIDAVESHVTELAEKANEYKRLFADTRSLASTAMQAAHAWRSVAAAVSHAGHAATGARAAAIEAATIAQGRPPLRETAEKSREKAEELRERGKNALTKAEDLGKQTDTIAHQLDLVSVSLRGVSWQERELNMPASANVGPMLANAHALADRVFATTRGIYDEASEMMTRIRYQLRRQLAELQRHGDSALGAAEEHVSQIKGNTLRGSEVSIALLAAASARTAAHERARLAIAPALQALRAKVQRAKHAAASISVSLTSAPGSACSRQFLFSSPSPAVSTLSLSISFRDVEDSPLLHVRDDEDPQKYMSLVIENSKLLLKWDLGSGEGYIVHPQELKSARLEADQGFYTISIERVWSTVHLQVEVAGHDAIKATNSTPLPGVTLSSSRVWLGGEEEGLGLRGCVHMLRAGGGLIPLWSWARQHGKCAGCEQKYPGAAPGTAPLVSFSGSGYAELRRSGLRPFDRRQFSVAFTFRTNDEDALLFMAVDAENRSVSISLEKCRVVLAVQYRGAALRVVARGSHCGRVTHVQATRVYRHAERGSLRVNGEETLGSPFPPVTSAAALPDLSSSGYWVGGVPPDMPPVSPLLGCLGALTVDREGYDLLDTVQRDGLEAGCVIKQTRSVLISSPGYLELPSPALRRRSSMGAAFRTRAPGLVLCRQHHALSVAIRDDGELEVKADLGKGESVLRTRGQRYDDDTMHVFRLVRAHKQLELWVDSTLAASGELTGGAFPASPQGLFLGGVPPELQGTGPCAGGSFEGTIADLIVDGEVLGFESPVSSSGVGLGRAGPAQTRPTEPTTNPVPIHTCDKPSQFSLEAGALRFGDTPGYTQLRLPRAPELALSVQLRSFSEDGVLLYIPGPKAKPRHYTVVSLVGGRVVLRARGRRRREVTVPVQHAQWTQVSVRILKGRLSLRAGPPPAAGPAPAAGPPPAAWRPAGPAPAHARRLYLAGLPPHVHASLPDHIRTARGLRGCIRQVWLDSSRVDLTRAASRGAAPCRADAEPGAYLTGSGYVSWGRWEGGEVRLQFRAEGGGVLLRAPGGVVELRGGAVILSRTVGSNSSVEARSVGGALCDAQFHVLRARMSSSALSVALDDAPDVRAGDYLLGDAAPLPPGPLYIGGVPEGTLAAPDGNLENFKGCIRDVTVAGQKKDWSEMEELHHVILDSCPPPQ